MNEMDFFKQVVELSDKEEKAAVATIIRTKGSTPRETGAKMIVLSECKVTGTFGGGCGEGAVLERSFSVIQTGISAQHKVVLTYGLMYADGGICGRIMDVFIEPIDSTVELFS